jgi:hypothetical protein
MRPAGRISWDREAGTSWHILAAAPPGAAPSPFQNKRPATDPVCAPLPSCMKPSALWSAAVAPGFTSWELDKALSLPIPRESQSLGMGLAGHLSHPPSCLLSPPLPPQLREQNGLLLLLGSFRCTAGVSPGYLLEPGFRKRGMGCWRRV